MFRFDKPLGRRDQTSEAIVPGNPWSDVGRIGSDLPRGRPFFGGDAVGIPCDVCTDPKGQTAKSCLECQTSYCRTHLEPHQRVTALQTHTLIDPVERLGDSRCQKHDRLLTLFCRAEQVTLCDFCIGTHSQDHEVVPVQRECREKRAQLAKEETTVQCMIHERQQKAKEFKREVGQSQEDGKSEIREIVQEVTTMMSAIEKIKAELIGAVDEKQKAAEKRAQDHVQDLEKEMTELRSLGTQLKELLDTKDNLQLLRKCPSQSVLPNTKDWSAIMASRELGTEHMRQSSRSSILQLQATVNQVSKNIKKFSDTQITDLRRMRQYAVDLVLDPSTACPTLVLSNDGKQVSYSTTVQRHVTGEKMFFNRLAVLGTTGFSSGKVYFEVYMGTKTEWEIGVATESINRRENIPRDPESGLWALMFILDRYEAFGLLEVQVNWRKVEKVGVFVDFEEGCVSFYDVEARCLIYSFTGCHFTERIYPYFNPCSNEYGANLAPLVITAVSHTE